MSLVHHLLGATAARTPDRRAVICDGRALTFAELDIAADALARELQCGGVVRGDRVGVIAGNSIEFVIALFAVLKAGGVLVPFHPTTRARKLAELLADCTPRTLVVTPAAAGLVNACAVAARFPAQLIWTDHPPDGSHPGPTLPMVLAGRGAAPRDPGLIDHDLCAVLYTSGTTAHPKGVMLTHRNLVNTTAAIAGYLGNVPEDVVACALPLSHSYGLCQVLVGARVGYTVLLEPSFAYPWEFLTRMREHQVTGLPGVPAMFAQILQIAGVELPSLRYLTNAAAGLAPAQILRLQALFPRAQLFLMYGLTECTRATWLDPARLGDKPGSVGKAIPNCETTIVGDDGRRVAPGVVGELVVRGANVMRGYWNRPEDTARALRDGDIPGEKVLHTGDLFRADDEGFLYFVGRHDDLFKCKGEKVSPKEIENVICELEPVVEAAVFGVDARADGLAIKAAVVLRPGTTLSDQDIRRHCRAHLESFLVPAIIEFCDALPRTEGGKLDRRALIRGDSAVDGASCAE